MLYVLLFKITWGIIVQNNYMDFLEFIQKRFPWVEFTVDNNPTPEKIERILSSIERNRNKKPIFLK